MVVADLLRLGIEILGKREFTNEQLEVRMILAKLLNVDKSYIYAHEDKELSDSVVEEFISIMKTRADGYPIQYILKEKEFMGLDFYIDQGVLIPRPDTEILVEYLIDYIKTNYGNEDIKILDLGIGSGAIGLSLAYYCKNIFLYASDISPEAIRISKINKDRFKLDNVKILEGDLFEPFEKLEKTFQIIVSNPPYIESKEIDRLQTEVKDYEPMLALDGGADGLKYYRDISKRAKEFLESGGLLIYEIGYNQGRQVSDIMRSEDYKDIQVLKDLQGLDRVVLGRWGV